MAKRFRYRYGKRGDPLEAFALFNRHFSSQNTGLRMISFGPQLVGVHSPDERLLIPTVDKFWKLLLEILKNIPAKR